MAASEAVPDIFQTALLSGASKVVVAYSGGLDSTVLLHLAKRRVPAEKLLAVHVNHNISANSDSWQKHCADTCRDLDIPLLCHRVDIGGGRLGPERAAREARYRVFEELLGTGDVLLMAHHLDDQAETVLYRLLRGAGPRGLAGIPVSRPLAAGHIYRPLLSYTRASLREYARARELAWVDDESNNTSGYDRNFLRLEVLPAIASRWPDYRQRLARSAEQCLKSDTILSDTARRDLADAGLREERMGASVDIAVYRSLSPERQQNLLRDWVRSRGYPALTHNVHPAIARDLLGAREDAVPQVSWPGGRFGRFRGRLYLLPRAERESPSPIDWNHPRPELPLPAGMVLRLVAATGPGALRLTASASVQVRFRSGGERCRPAGRGSSAPLKKLLQASSLEPWLRSLVPLVFVDGNLAAVADLFVCAGHECAEGESGFTLRWQKTVCD